MRNCLKVLPMKDKLDNDVQYEISSTYEKRINIINMYNLIEVKELQQSLVLGPICNVILN